MAKKMSAKQMLNLLREGQEISIPSSQLNTFMRYCHDAEEPIEAKVFVMNGTATLKPVEPHRN